MSKWYNYDLNALEKEFDDLINQMEAEKKAHGGKTANYRYLHIRSELVQMKIMIYEIYGIVQHVSSLQDFQPSTMDHAMVKTHAEMLVMLTPMINRMWDSYVESKIPQPKN